MPWPSPRKLSAVPASDVTEASPSPSTRFAFRLFQELAGADASNVFFSPSSVMLCLAMLHEAACGETRRAMAQALEIAGLNPADIGLVITALRAPFRQREHVEVRGANSLWCSDCVQVRPEYAVRLRNTYDAQLATLDFEGADAVPRINAWVHEQTNGKISHIVDVLSPLTALVAANAVYFKGSWTRIFDRALTRNGLFSTATDKRSNLG